MRLAIRISSAILLFCALPLFSVAQIWPAKIFETPVQDIELLFAGDIMQHETQLNMARQKNGEYSYSYCFHHISPLVKNAYKACSDLAYAKIYCASSVVEIDLAGNQIIAFLMKKLINNFKPPYTRVYGGSL